MWEPFTILKPWPISRLRLWPICLPLWVLLTALTRRQRVRRCPHHSPREKPGGQASVIPTGQKSGCLISCTYDWSSGKEGVSILPERLPLLRRLHLAKHEVERKVIDDLQGCTGDERGLAETACHSAVPTDGPTVPAILRPTTCIPPIATRSWGCTTDMV